MLRYLSTPAFLCCDLQASFATRLPRFQHGVFVAKRFLAFHELFPGETSYVATEQYPKGLGRLVPEIGIEAAQQREMGAKKIYVFEKTTFSMITPEVTAQLEGHDSIVLFGIEAHACILQTTDDLVAMGKKVYIAADGTFSQRDEDRKYAFKTMMEFGKGNVFLTTSESILLALLRDAAHPKFKQVSALLRQQAPVIGKEK